MSNPTAPSDAAADTTRLETFSDGVIAIAITLLVLEITVPTIAHDKSLGHELLKEWPSYLGYAVSFLTLGTMWINHHNRFREIVRADQGLLSINTLLLMAMAFLPFSTALVADYVTGSPEQQLTASAIYTGTTLAIAVLFNVLLRYASSDHRLLDDRVSDARLRSTTRRYNAGVLIYSVAFILSFVWFPAALGICAIMAVVFLLPEPATNRTRGDSDARTTSD